jgi:glucuronate isomerase
VDPVAGRAQDRRTFSPATIRFSGNADGIWLDHAFHEVFGIRERLTTESADRVFDLINGCLARPEFRPRAVRAFQHRSDRDDRVAADPFAHHAKIRASG